jgi:multiple sugar transport system permease protein/sn-glycerol 3-phosphate transport system permease protein
MFIYWPLVEVIYLSFVRLDAFGPDDFVGLANYAAVLDHTQFRAAAWNSFWYLLLSLPLKVLLPLPLAMFIWVMPQRLGGAYKSILFVPTLLSFVVVSIAWIALLNPMTGLIQNLIAPFGLKMPMLLANPDTALYVIVGVASWKILGFNVLLYLAGLAAIDREPIEAMRMDGAREGTIVRRLILPLLSPTILFVTISTVVFSIQQVFTPIDVMTQGGPLNSTTNLFYLVYQYMFEGFNPGYSAAGAVLIFLILGALVAVKTVIGNRHVHYN